MWLRRIFALIFLALALWGIAWTTPQLLSDLTYERLVVTTRGWFTDVEEQRECIHYAYKVGNVTYGGCESWNDETSDIYYRHDGDPLAVVYLADKPWLSRSGRNFARHLQISGGLMAFFALLLLGSILLLRPRRKPNAVLHYLVCLFAKSS